MASQDKTDVPNTEFNSDMALQSMLGVDSSQIEEAPTSTVTKVLDSNEDKLRELNKGIIKENNEEHGTKISFVALVKSGFLQDANGNEIKKDGKRVPRYIQKPVTGYFVIDEVTKEVKNPETGKMETHTFYKVATGMQYLDKFTVASYTELPTPKKT
jgi:hypothetical protein